MEDDIIETHDMALGYILRLICERTKDLQYACLYDEAVIDLEVLGYIYKLLLKNREVVKNE